MMTQPGGRTGHSWVITELEADGVGQPQDGHLLAGQEVPACLHAGQAVVLDVGLLLCRRHLLGVSRSSKLTVTTLNSLPMVQGTAPSPEARSLRPARQLGTAIIRHHENGRLGTGAVGQRDRLAVLVAELQIERHLGVEVLTQTDFTQDRRPLVLVGPDSRRR